jgi:nucleotide-binding universal stress UspA family protein
MSPVPPEAFDGPQVIVAGIDSSTTSMRAGAYAAGLARRERCRLIVVHVMEAPTLAYMAPEVTAAARITAREADAELRDELLAQAARRGVHAEFRQEEGDPFSVLSKVASEVHADLVVVGASSRLGHRIAGSVAVRLVKTGRWPVTVVP